MRFHFAASLAALALAGCSGGNETAPDAAASNTETAPASVPAAVQSEPAPQASATQSAPAPEPTPTSTPSPRPTPSAEPAAAPASAPAKIAEAAPPPEFARCAVCHNAAKGAPDKIGPNLFGVYGKKAAQGSFAFSDALKNAGLTLDEATLDKWIENPRAMVPGNRMSFPGIKDPAKRQAIIDYLKQQR